jgi:hypothetical protein
MFFETIVVGNVDYHLVGNRLRKRLDLMGCLFIVGFGSLTGA